MIITVLGKNPPGKKPPDSKPNPIPNLNLTLPLTPHRGLFLRGFFPDTDNNIQQIRIRLCVFSLVLTFCVLNDLEIGNFFCLLISGYWACFSIGQSNKKLICNFVFFAFFCFLFWFFFTDTGNKRDSRRREGTTYSFLPLPPAHKHSDIFLQLCL